MKLCLLCLLLAGCSAPFEAAIAEPTQDGAPDAPADGGASAQDGGGGEGEAAPEGEAGQVLDTGPHSEAEACALVTHTDGIGQSWQDCVPEGTYDEQEARRACESSGAQCVPSDCNSDAGVQAICSACACWTFQGPYGAGSVYATTACADSGVQQHCGGGATWR